MSNPASVTTNEGTRRIANQTPWRAPISAPIGEHRKDARPPEPVVVDDENAENRRCRARDGADGKIDLPEQQHKDDADGDRA